VSQRLESSGIAQQLLRLEAHQDLLAQLFCQAINKRESSVRLVLLFASILKLEKMGRAVRLLASDAFAEEIQALSRTMAEVTINAAYLQDAEDEEVERFQHFDTQSTFRHATRLRPHTTIKSTKEDIRKMEEVVDKARLLTGRKDNDPSWSKRTVLQRAEYSDAITRLDLMGKLVLTSYAYGHSAIHGTFDSLDSFIPINGKMHESSIGESQEALFLALFSVNFTLSVMCYYLNGFFHLELESAITNAGKLMA